jgi:uncharacterized phage-associated protein
MSGVNLARWILHKHEPVTHLALQKLVFYCYGGALAFDQEGPLGEVSFEAWTHGPVNRDVWETCREFGRATIPREAAGPGCPTFNSDLERTLDDVLTVYGALDAWSLREQSHLEQPWIDAFESGRARRIDPLALKQHFKGRLAGATIKPPEYLLHTATFTLDGVPAPAFASLRQLADATRALTRG